MFFMSFPNISISPSVGFNKPSINFINVVFPAPFGPIIPIISPLLTEKSTPFIASARYNIAFLLL